MKQEKSEIEKLQLKKFTVAKLDKPHTVLGGATNTTHDTYRSSLPCIMDSRNC